MEAGRAAFETERLVLRRWLSSDRAPFAALNSDPQVMEFFPGLLSREQSDWMVDRIEAHFDEHGFGLFAMERKDSGEFIGFTGLQHPSFEADFTPCVEIGWRIAREHQRQGFASEASRRVLELAFGELALGELVSFTASINQPSQAVMRKLGFRPRPELNFAHPKLSPGHRLEQHVVYSLAAEDYRAGQLPR